MDNNNDCNNAGGKFFSWFNCVKADEGNMGYGQSECVYFKQFIEYVYRDRTYAYYCGCHRFDNGVYHFKEGVLA